MQYWARWIPLAFQCEHSRIQNHKVNNLMLICAYNHKRWNYTYNPIVRKDWNKTNKTLSRANTYNEVYSLVWQCTKRRVAICLQIKMKHLKIEMVDVSRKLLKNGQNIGQRWSEVQTDGRTGITKLHQEINRGT